MGAIDLIGFILSVFGAYNVILFLLGLLPTNVLPHVLIRLNELESSLNNAEAVDTIPSTSQFRMDFGILHSQFLRMRTTSHRSPLFYQQLWLALSGLTCQLYIIYVQAGAIRREVEMVMDEHLLASLAVVQSAAATASPAPAPATAVPAANVAAPTPPPPVAAS